MPQRVPPFEFSDPALRVRQFLYEYWCERGHGPNLRAVHEATGLSRQQVIEAYKELELGLTLVCDQTTQHFNLLKLQPFSSYPSQVEVHIDGRFHSYAGCAMESMAISKMPPFAGKELTLESYCPCCMQPVTLVQRDGELLSVTPESALIHVTSSPRDWGNPNIVHMCDTMNFVIDEHHARDYERQVSRLGVLFTLPQAQLFVSDTARNRMWKYDWPPVPIIPEVIMDGIKAVGVDTTNWAR